MSLLSPRLFVCDRCGADYLAWQPECDGCRSASSLRRIPPSRRGNQYGSAGYRPAPRRRPPTRSLEELVAKATPVRMVPWGYEALTLPPEARVAADGPPGGGKSTLSAFMALVLAARGVRVLVLSVEEGLAPTAIARWTRCADQVGYARPPANVELADVRDPEEARSELDAWRARGPGCVVIDSTSDLRCSDEWLAGVYADDALGIVTVQHVVTSGAPRGGWEIAHKADVRVTCRELTASITKNRWGSCTSFPILEPLRIADPPRGEVVPFPGRPS